MDWKKMNASVVVPTSKEVLDKLRASLQKCVGEEPGPATWRDFMPEATEGWTLMAEKFLGVECFVVVDEHYQGGYFAQVHVRPGEAPYELDHKDTAKEALLGGVAYLLGFEDYGDIPEVAQMMED